MFDANVDALFNDAAIDQFVDSDADGRFSHVKDNAGSSVVSLVGHTLVNGRVGKNIDIVTNLDLHEVLGEVDRSVLTELFGKHVARTRPCSV